MPARVLYEVVRNCCNSGNCLTCRGKSPLGEPLRIIQARNLTERQALDMVKGWRYYAAEMRKQQS